MKILKQLLLLLLLALSPVYAYNYSWSSREDIQTPKPPPCTGECCEQPGGCPPDPCDDTSSGGPGSPTGSPVYLQSGHFSWDTMDLAISGKPDLFLGRHYTSSESRVGLFGNGWISNFEVAVIKTIKGNDVDGNLSFDTIYINRQDNGKRYQYTEVNSSISSSHESAHKVSRIDSKTLQLEYKNGEVEQHQDGNIVLRKDKNGNSLYMQYDTNYLLQKVEDENGRSLNFYYNSQGFVSEVIDHTGRSWNYEYDGNGNLITFVNPTGEKKTYEYQSYKPAYDAQIYFQLTKIVDESGRDVINVTYSKDKVASYTAAGETYRYVYNGNTVTKTNSANKALIYTLNNDGFISSVKDTSGNVTSMTFDAAGKPLTATNANGYTTSRTMDAQGRMVEKISSSGNKTIYTYEGNETKPSSISLPSGATTTVTYDDKKRPIAFTDAKGNIQKVMYDKNGNIIKAIDALGNVTETAYNSNNQPTSIKNPLGQTTFVTYDNLGRKSTVTDAQGRKVTYGYDAMDRVISITDALGKAVVYGYDEAGRLLSIKDPVNNEVHYQYDTQGRVTKETRAGGRATQYSYNSDNTINQIIRQDGKIVQYQYNANKWPVKHSIDGDEITYTYDSVGHILSATNSSGTVSFEYNEDGKLISETQNGINITMDYDVDGHINTLNYLGRTIKYGHDSLGLMTSLTTPKGSTQFEYDKNGVQTAVLYPNQTREDRAFNADYTVKQITTAGETLNYGFDATGLVTSKNDMTYRYDQIGRLIEGNNETFSYDSIGNITNDNAVYDLHTNQLISNEFFTFEYDLMGNLKTKVNKLTGTRNEYVFNARDQLIQYVQKNETNATIKTIDFTYDAFGRRVSKNEDGLLKKFLYNKEDLVAIVDDSNNIIATINYDKQIDRPLSITNTNGTFYYHRDHLGNIIALTNSSGTVVESFEYGNYGEVLTHHEIVETDNPFAYTAREFDTEDLYFYRARYYDPMIKRFISSDPIGYMSGELNLYNYVGNNPVNMVDPRGLRASGSWITPPTVKNLDLDITGFEFISTSWSWWGYVKFMRLTGIVSGDVYAKIKCIEEDECGNISEWTADINVHIAYNGHFDFGPNAYALAIGLRFGGLYGLGANLLLLGGSVASGINEWYQRWGALAQNAKNQILTNGPDAYCN